MRGQLLLSSPHLTRYWHVAQDRQAGSQQAQHSMAVCMCPCSTSVMLRPEVQLMVTAQSALMQSSMP